jgi:hypothetical protein
MRIGITYKKLRRYLRNALTASRLRYGVNFIFLNVLCLVRARTAQSVHRLATGWTVRDRIPMGGEIFRTRPDRPWGPPSLLYNGYRVFPGGKAAGAWCQPPTPFSSKVPRPRQCTAIPLPPRAFESVTGYLYLYLCWVRWLERRN